MTQRKLVVLGGGESGVGAARLAQAKGFEVFLSDKSPLQARYHEALQAAGIAFEEGTHTEARILDADEVVKSPGIPDKVDIIQKLRAAGIPVVSEIEFAARYTQAKIIAITGSNGKTTTTLLTHHLLRAAGVNAGLAGNVGNSFADLVIEDSHDWYVLEVSSFQLDNCHAFRPHIALLTNITPDHLDRYEYQFQNYVDAKFRIAQSQTPDDFLIYYQDDPVIAAELGRHRLTPALLPISITDPAAAGYFDPVTETLHVSGLEVPMAGLPLTGTHNALNMLAASAAALLACRETGRVLDLPPALATFQNAPHRLEPVGSRNGVAFVNDSKATNVDSVFYALGSFKQPVVWIAGGVDKGNDYTQIEALVRQNVKALICLGRDNGKLVSFFTGKVPELHQTQDIREAVALGLRLARPGDTVLLSPACASFDLFRNYEDRGDQFRSAVAALP